MLKKPTFIILPLGYILLSTIWSFSLALGMNSNNDDMPDFTKPGAFVRDPGPLKSDLTEEQQRSEVRKDYYKNLDALLGRLSKDNI